MAPPATPSPYRFLMGQRRRASPTKETQPSPAHGSKYRKSEVESHENTTDFPSSQFAPRPRFGKTKPSPSQQPQSPPEPTLARALRASINPTEAVEDTSDADEDDDMLDNEKAYAIPTTEQHDDEEAWTKDLALSPKRRRIDPDERFSPPDRAVFKQPQTPASYYAKGMPRVLPPQSQVNVPTQLSGHGAPRPPFLRSSVAPPEPTEPLPDAFSPHRRGQKYIPGGMAATMQQWVLEAGQTAAQSRRGQAYLKGEDYVMQARIVAVEGDGPHVAKAKSAADETFDLLVASSTRVGGVRQRIVTASSTIGIRAPTWSVEIEGTEYMVAVDWRCLPTDPRHA